MRAAFSVWNDRISPVFDTSRRFLVLDIEDGAIVARSEEEFLDLDPLRKLAKLIEMQVQVMVCGAISRPVADMAAASGIETYAFIAGEVDKVIAALLTNGLSNPTLRMPGCCGRGIRSQRGRCWRQGMELTQTNKVGPSPSKERSQVMPKGDGTGPQGQGPGTGRGRGGCGKGSGQPAQPGQGRGTGRGAGQGAGKGSGKGRGQGRKGNQ
jgi:predicted Fe-Mo cluster-binding NifX family protein